MGEFNTKDGVLEVFARFTANEKKAAPADEARCRQTSAASSHGPEDSVRCEDGDDAQDKYKEPKPKSMPVRKSRPVEPAYPPSLGFQTVSVCVYDSCSERFIPTLVHGVLRGRVSPNVKSSMTSMVPKEHVAREKPALPFGAVTRRYKCQGDLRSL